MPDESDEPSFVVSTAIIRRTGADKNGNFLLILIQRR